MSHNPMGFVLDVTAEAIDGPPLLFLACPYSHPDPVTRAERARTASDMAAHLMGGAGYAVYSPISHGHAVCEENTSHAVGTDAAAWAAVNDAILPICHALVVLDIPGLWESAGVRREVALAVRFGLPVNLVRFNGYTVEMEPDIDPMTFSDSVGRL